MINWLIVVLVVLNLGVLAWGLQRDHQRQESHGGRDNGIPRLVLVEEQQARESEQAANSAAARMAPEGQAGQAREGALDSSSEQAAVGAVSPDAEPALEASTQAYCYKLGPFQKRDDAEVVLELLRPAAAAADIRREVEREEIGYWVLIPPLKSESEAISTFEALKAAGVTDLWRFTRGSLANAISLGLFARQSLAQAHSENVNRKGFVTEVRPRLAEKSTYWIDARFPETQDTTSGVWGRLSRDYPDVQSATAQCEL